MMAELTMENPLASQPQLNKIAEDTIDCIAELKKEFVETKVPVNDDNQILHRFCAKLEYLLTAEMKEKTTLLGRKKDYWDFFCDCLSSTKGLNDGIKFVKSTGEYKTSLGRGRAFLRFSLVHQRLADTLQQCVMNGKVTSDWYTTKSVWLQHNQKAEIIAALYDLTEVNFDLSSRGYDLDNAWPSFSRKTGGGAAPHGNWNPPSRASSYTSIVSIPGNESVYTGRERRDTISSTVSEADYDQLQRELSQVEGEKSHLSTQVEELEREKTEVSESVMDRERTLSDLDKQLKQAQDRCRLLETEMSLKEKLWMEKEELLQQSSADKLSMAEERIEQLRLDINQKESSFVLMEDSYRSQVQQVESKNQKLSLEVKLMRQDTDHATAQVNAQSESIAGLQAKLESAEGKNRELLDKMEVMIAVRDDVLEELKTSERVNVELQGKQEEATWKIENLEMALEEKTRTLDSTVEQFEQSRVELMVVEGKFIDLKQKNDKDTEQLRSVLSGLDEKKTETERLNDSLKQLKGQLKEKDAAGERLSADMELLKEKHMTLLFTSNQQQQKDTKLTQALHAAENLNLKIKAEVDKLKAGIQERESELRTEQSGHIKRLDELMGNMKELQECKDRLGEKVQRSGVDKVRLEQELENVRGQLRESTGTASEIREQEDCLKSVIYSLRAVQAGEEQTNAFAKKTSVLNDENVKSSIESFQTLYRKQQDQTKVLESKYLQLQNDLSTQSEESSEKGRQLQSIQLEMENLKAMNTALQSSEADVSYKMQDDAAQIKLKNDRIIDLESDTRVKEEKICQLENEVRIKSEELVSENEQILEMSTSIQVTDAELQRSSQNREKLDIDLKDNENKLCAFEQNLQSASQQIKVLTAEKSELQNKLEISDKTVTDLQHVKRELKDNIHGLEQSQKSQLDQVRQTRSQELETLKQEFSLETSEKNEALNKVSNLQTKVDKLNLSVAELESRHKSEQKTSEQSLGRLSNELESLQAEKIETETTLTELGVEIKQLKSENMELTEQNNKHEKTKTELSDKILSLEMEITELTEKRIVLEKMKRELGGEVEQLKTENTELTRVIAEGEKTLRMEYSELNQFKTEHAETLKNLTLELQSLRTENVELTQTKAERETSLGEEIKLLNTEISELTQKKEEQEKEVSELNVALLSLKTDTLSLESSREESIKLLESEKAQSNQFTEEITKSRIETENLQSQVVALEMEKTNFEEKLDRVLNDTVDSNQLHELAIEEKLSEVEKLRENIEALHLALDNEKEAAVTLREEHEMLQSRVDGLGRELANLKEEQVSTLRSVEEKENEVTVAKLQLVGDRKAIENQIEVQEQEIQSLKFQLSSQQLLHEQALTSYTSQVTDIGQMTDRLGEQEQLIDQLETEMTHIKQIREEEQRQQITQLDDLKKSLEAREDEVMQFNAKLLQASSHLKEERDKVTMLETQQTMVQHQSEDSLKRGQQKRTVLLSDNAQLKKKLVKLIKEKDALWQKTDTLVFQQRVRATEKWMEDNEVNNCLGCRIEFSFTLRKHHCRLCGRIFCWNCSNNWILTAHSNKKARVCNGCNSQQSEVGGAIDSSLVGNDSEDEQGNLDESEVNRLKGADHSVSQSSESQDGTTSPSMDLSGIMSGDTDSVASIDVRAMNSSGPITEADLVSDNQTEDPKTETYTFPTDFNNELTSTTEEVRSVSDTGGNSESDKEDPFHVISQEEIEKSVSEAMSSPPLSLDISMTTSLMISVEELEKGHVNSSNEVWLKAGKRFAVPILIEAMGVVLYWEFTTQPKDIGFSATYAESETVPPHEVHVLIQPCKCNSHKQTVKGELTTKKSGVYTLMFDNTYSKLTTKKLNYSLCVKRK